MCQFFLRLDILHVVYERGPFEALYFFIYVNGMFQNVNCDMFLYVDNATLLASGKYPT